LYVPKMLIPVYNMRESKGKKSTLAQYLAMSGKVAIINLRCLDVHYVNNKLDKYTI